MLESLLNGQITLRLLLLLLLNLLLLWLQKQLILWVIIGWRLHVIRFLFTPHFAYDICESHYVVFGQGKRFYFGQLPRLVHMWYDLTKTLESLIKSVHSKAFTLVAFNSAYVSLS